MGVKKSAIALKTHHATTRMVHVKSDIVNKDGRDIAAMKVRHGLITTIIL